MASAMESDSGGGSGGADAQPPLAEVDGGLARVTRQLLLSGDDPAARLRALMHRRRLQRRIAGLLPPPARRLNISRGSEFTRDVRGLVEEHAQASSLSAAAVWRAGLLAPGEVAVAGGGSGGGSFSWSGWRPPVFGDFLIHASSFNNAEATGTPLFQFKQSDPFSGRISGGLL